MDSASSLQPMPDPYKEAKRRAESVRREHARLLITNGRAWLPLTEEDIERGARAVERDPYYRNEIVRCALLHAQEIGNPDNLIDRVRDALIYLEQFDGRDDDGR